jgi:hypothetical protein
MTLLCVVVVLRDLGTELNLTDRDLLLVLACSLELLRLLVLVLIEHTADGRTRIRSDLNQVKVTLLGVRQRLGGLHDTDLFPVITHEPNFWHADAVIDTGLVPFRQTPVEPTRDRH